ncbi:lycopene cyclase domain-containing protein [Brevibacterium sanguinis]|uniref:Lycopene cyclase domain-containing protein n=2 Tax=Brevibacterium TaxID=1696 RepID=A0A366IGH5_9MICO|nr:MULTISPECIES: lycopene cyclase domain-containing protein [Brevibacterium]RBP62190.1 lycopene cyclase domain-containing protein [Brevibacterium sanguinis]RBP70678.1 lycopene cyclase domain-containing protein [Brevibacterium celere]
MTHMLYLVALLVSSACLVVLDLRYRLVLPRLRWRAVLVLVTGVVFFLAWDLAAIAAGHYAVGSSALMTGIMLAPELPLEEIVFITFLSYLALLVHRIAARSPREAPRSPRKARRSLRQVRR